MRAGRSEVLDVFSKWLSEGAPLEVTITFPAFAARLRGRLTFFSSDEVRVMSADTNSELAFRLKPDLAFEFADAALVGGPDLEGFKETLVCIFRFGEDEFDDSISFTEIVT